jgi:hypothetical protein
MFKSLVTLALLLIFSAHTQAQVASQLVGRYQMDVQGGEILELRANGSASLAGEETTWSASGTRLSIGPDAMQYSLQGDRLLLTMGTIQIPWKKIGGAVKAPTSKQKDEPGAKGGQPGTGGADADREAKQVLMSTAWCSFTYNKVSGTSTTRKVVFRQDGVMTVNGGAETYSSGYGGTVAGQSNSAGAMRWKLENLRMFVDQGNGAGFQDIGLNATKNSNGYVILHAGGREYSMCK